MPQANNYQIKHDHNSTYKILTIFMAGQSEILLLRLCNNNNNSYNSNKYNQKAISHNKNQSRYEQMSKVEQKQPR